MYTSQPSGNEDLEAVLRDKELPYVISGSGNVVALNVAITGRLFVQRGAVLTRDPQISFLHNLGTVQPDLSQRLWRDTLARILSGGGIVLMNALVPNRNGNKEQFVRLSPEFDRKNSSRTVFPLRVTEEYRWRVRSDTLLAITDGIDLSTHSTLTNRDPRHGRLLGISGSFSILDLGFRQQQHRDLEREHVFLSLREGHQIIVVPPGRGTIIDFGHIVAFPECAWIIASGSATQSFASDNQFKRYFERKFAERTAQITARNAAQATQEKNVFLRMAKQICSRQSLAVICRGLILPVRALQQSRAAGYLSVRHSPSALRHYCEDKVGPIAKRTRLGISTSYFLKSAMQSFVNCGFVKFLNAYSSGEGPVFNFVYNPTDKPIAIICQTASELPGFGTGIVGGLANAPSKLFRFGNSFVKSIMNLRL